MVRAKKPLIYIAIIFGIWASFYLSLPWIISTSADSFLSEQGAYNIKLKVGYPDWRGIQIKSLSFNMDVGEYQSTINIPHTQIFYTYSLLVAGGVGRIQIPTMTVEVKPSGSQATSSSNHSLEAIATLISGQWLSQLPAREVSLEQVAIITETHAKEVFSSQLSVQLKDKQLQLKGHIQWPLMTLKATLKPTFFSITMLNTGETKLIVLSGEHAANSVMTFTSKPAVIDSNASGPLIVRGKFTANLKKIESMFIPLFKLKSINMRLINGRLNGRWKMQLEQLGEQPKWTLSGAVRVSKLKASWGKYKFPTSEWKAKYKILPGQVALASTLTSANKAIQIDVDSVHRFATLDGHSTFEIKPIKVSDLDFILEPFLNDLSDPIVVKGGEVSAKGRLSWAKNFKAQVSLKLNKLSGQFRKMTFQGFSADLALSLRNPKKFILKSRQDATISIDLVDVGIPIKNINIVTSIEAKHTQPMPLLRVQSVDAQLLGGRVMSEPFNLDLNLDKNAFVVKIDKLQLADIMKLEQQEGLSGDGLLSGEIPVEITGEGVVVKQGTLFSVGTGGAIRYIPAVTVAAMAEKNSSIQTALGALSNFQYHRLDVASDYTQAGDLTLKIRLEGKNPDWQQGQPVHLNLNLQENIPTLLRSLQLSGELSERVRKHYNK